jgi:DNA-binding response OmpR family regulator
MVAARHALVVEPDAALAGTLRSALETCGFSVDVVGEGNAASLRLTTTTPELLLLDIEPAMADSLLRQVKKKRKQTPVLVMSPNGDGDGMLRRWFGRSPDVVLRKPLAIEELLRQVRLLFPLGQPSQLGTTEEPTEEIDGAMVVESQEEEKDTEVREAGSSKSSTSSFAREHESLELRQRINGLEKQLLDLREEVDRKERQILQGRQASLDLERKANALNDTILGLEQSLLSANERIDTLEREEEVLMQSLAAKEQEMRADQAHARETLAAAQAAAVEEAKRQKAALERDHAAQMERQRKEHQSATVSLNEQHRSATEELKRTHAAAIANLENKLAKAIDTVRENARQVNQAREAIASANALLGKHVAEVSFNDVAPVEKKK